MRNWMDQHEIPAPGEQITFTAQIRQGDDPELKVTVKHKQLPEWRIVRTILTNEEWSQVLSVVTGPKQRSLLEFLRSGPNQQRTRESMYGRWGLTGAGFVEGNATQANKTLREAGLPFRISTVLGQKRYPTHGRFIALMVIASLVES